MSIEQKTEKQEVQELKVLATSLQRELTEVKKFSGFMDQNLLQLGERYNDSKLTEHLQWRETISEKESALYQSVEEVASLYRETKNVLSEELEKREEKN